MILRTLECGSCIANNSKIDEIQVLVLAPFWVSFWRCFGSPNGGQEHQKEVLKSLSKSWRQNYHFLIDFGVPLGSKMEPKIDQTSIIFQVGDPEGPRGRFWKDFGPILELFWDDFLKVFGRISMLGLIVFKVFALTFGGRWCEISLCGFHPFGYDLSVVLYVVRHVSFICLSMPLWNDSVHVWRHGESFGLVCCDVSGLLTCDLLRWIWFAWYRFRMVWAVCADWWVLVSSVWWFLSVFVCWCRYCPG